MQGLLQVLSKKKKTGFCFYNGLVKENFPLLRFKGKGLRQDLGRKLKK